MPSLMTVHRLQLEARCEQRGYKLDDVMPCVVSQDGDRWTIDTDHPVYPHRRIGLGDVVAAGLAAVGVTPQLVERITGRKDCGCKRRQQALNEAGWAVQRAVREIVAGE